MNKADFEKAVASFNEEGNHEKQLPIFEYVLSHQDEFSANEIGNAYCDLGIAYLLGRGTKQYLVKAEELFLECHRFFDERGFDEGLYNKLENLISIHHSMSLEIMPTILAKGILFPNEASIEDEFLLMELDRRNEKENEYLQKADKRVKVMYLHGLGGSRYSNMASYLRKTQDFAVYTFDIPAYPLYAWEKIEEEVRKIQPDVIVASSLGAFYALHLPCRYRVLINPALFGSKDIDTAIEKKEYKYKTPHLDYQAYVVDDDFISALQILENTKGGDFRFELGETNYGIFSDMDELFSHRQEFANVFGERNIKDIHSEHDVYAGMHGHIVKHFVLRCVRSVLNERKEA